MTQEEKAKAYNKAIIMAKKELDACGSQNCDATRQIFRLFPELKENKDEKIRKEIINYFRCQSRDEPGRKDTHNKWITFLEKQSEQKPEELPNGEDYGIDSLYHAVRILEKTLGEVEGYQSDDGILEHKCAISAIKKLSKQKSAWSEEDEEAFHCLEYTVKHYYDDKDTINRCRSWLKSLKERVQSQPKYQWTDEDEKNLKDLLAYGETKLGLRRWIAKLLEKLGSRSEYHWKPSEQNIKDLEWCADLVQDKMGVGFHRLQVLIDELKKL